jgi:hypothetical protein
MRLLPVLLPSPCLLLHVALFSGYPKGGGPSETPANREVALRRSALVEESYTHISEQAKVIALRQASQGRKGSRLNSNPTEMPSPMVYGHSSSENIGAENRGGNRVHIPNIPSQMSVLGPSFQTWSYGTRGRPFGTRGST